LPAEEQKEINKTKMILQLKILHNTENTDEAGKPKSTGIGFIEVSNEDLALYLVRNLNNFITNLKREKGLIVDFATEDHRKLLKRKQKLESFQIKLKQARKEKRKKKREEKAHAKENDASEEYKITIDQINDLETLRNMLEG